jgi:NADP-dependent 3-hydroxy acid dehydrogenase YdfG
MNNGNAPSLTGKTAVVTGSSSGIGRAIAERLGGAGAHVYLSGRTIAAMEESKKRIQAAGGRATPVMTDVRDTAQVQGLVDRAVEETGHLDIMVNNAGVSHPEPIVEGQPEHWREMFETNVIALLAGCQAAVHAMRKTGAQGHIVNISSVAALRPDSGVYGSTKHAVNCISRTLRNELENDSIRVVTIMPGAIATNFARNFDPAVIAPLVRVAGVDVELKARRAASRRGVRPLPSGDAPDSGQPGRRRERGSLRRDAADRGKRRRDRGPAAEAAGALEKRRRN